MFFLPQCNTFIETTLLLDKCFQTFRFDVIGKGIVKGDDVFVFHIVSDVIAGRHLNDDTGILLQCPWTVRFVISL